MATAVEERSEADARRERLRNDGIFYAYNCIKLVDLYGQLVPLVARKGQRRIEEAIQTQQQANQPIRVIVDKARRVGSSTWAVMTLIRSATQHENSQAQITAQNRKTAAELFDISKRMYQNLPNEEWLKPPLYQDRDSLDLKYMWWGEKSKFERNRGNLGLNSQLTVDTAATTAGGRGQTIRYLLATEFAHWPDPDKSLGLLSAVSDVPGTVLIVESTPKGHDEAFKPLWDSSERGESGFIPVFVGWHDVEHFVRPFTCTCGALTAGSPEHRKGCPHDQERARFMDTIGKGPFGADEPDLIRDYGCTPEQLNWRRATIVSKTRGKIELFRQEYASNAAESFIGSGKHVFSVIFTAKALSRTEKIEKLPVEQGGPQVGVFKATGWETRRVNDGTLEVPTGALWVPSEDAGLPIGADFWTRWLPDNRALFQAYLRNEITEEQLHAGLDEEDEEEYEQPSQYIAAVDAASGEMNTLGDSDYHSIQVIDHRTREQVARLQTRSLDADEVALQAVLAGLYYWRAMISVETTGGYGVPIVRKIYDAYGYRRVYKRRAIEADDAKPTKRLGWDTNRRTKPLMVEGFREMLREATHGLRDRQTALELNTYVVDERGRQGADKTAHDDMLSAYMQAQEVARETRLRADGPSGVTSTWTKSRTTDRRRF